jgi:hypothetical protein
MKKFLLLVFGIMLFNLLSAQDLIIKKNGDEINGKIQEVGITEIKYKKPGNPDGPLYAVLKSEVFMVKYENGTKEVFTTENSAATNSNVAEPPAQITETAKATVIIYRRNSPSGFAITYDVLANAKYITKVTNNFYYSGQFDAGYATFTAKTEREVSTSMNLEPGKTYYLRCGVSTGMWMGVPSLEFVSENTGIVESSRIKHK